MRVHPTPVRLSGKIISSSLRFRRVALVSPPVLRIEKDDIMSAVFNLNKMTVLIEQQDLSSAQLGEHLSQTGIAVKLLKEGAGGKV